MRRVTHIQKFSKVDNREIFNIFILFTKLKFSRLNLTLRFEHIPCRNSLESEESQTFLIFEACYINYSSCFCDQIHGKVFFFGSQVKRIWSLMVGKACRHEYKVAGHIVCAV